MTIVFREVRHGRSATTRSEHHFLSVTSRIPNVNHVFGRQTIRYLRRMIDLLPFIWHTVIKTYKQRFLDDPQPLGFREGFNAWMSNPENVENVMYMASTALKYTETAFRWGLIPACLYFASRDPKVKLDAVFLLPLIPI